jgi:dihydrofolate synthase / folylpolyglutamate synthase
VIPSGSSSASDVDARMREVEVALMARAPESDIEPGTDRVAAVLAAMGDPQRSFPSIHVAGTNGKTSTTRMVDALLRALDLRTGVYTSPHLESITERICVDGEPIGTEAGAGRDSSTPTSCGPASPRSARRVGWRSSAAAPR